MTHRANVYAAVEASRRSIARRAAVWGFVLGVLASLVVVGIFVVLRGVLS